MRKKYRIFNIAFIFAILLVLYPFLANIYNNWVQQQEIVEYEQSVSTLSNEDYSLLIEEAVAWNEELYSYIEPSYFPEGMTNTEIYESLLNVNGDGMIGYIVIPKIDVNLPIYHYATDDVLLKGAGHMEASALPVGGESTHCVITAHRGLPSAEMFTNLDQLEIGDVFYSVVLGEIFAYEVIEIQEVSPEETQTLLPVEGEDLMTLVTCTPYGVNSHRLLVTGTRTDYDPDEDEEGSVIADAFKSDWILVLVACGEAVLYFILRRRIKNNDQNQA